MMMADIIFHILIVLLIVSIFGLIISGIEIIDNHLESHKKPKLKLVPKTVERKEKKVVIDPNAIDLFPQLFFNSKASH